jgi:hypothetical protein
LLFEVLKKCQTGILSVERRQVDELGQRVILHKQLVEMEIGRGGTSPTTNIPVIHDVVKNYAST